MRRQKNAKKTVHTSALQELLAIWLVTDPKHPTRSMPQKLLFVRVIEVPPRLNLIKQDGPDLVCMFIRKMLKDIVLVLPSALEIMFDKCLVDAAYVY